MKKTISSRKPIRSKKLKISKQTIRTLQTGELRQIAGAGDTETNGCACSVVPTYYAGCQSS